MENKVCFLFGHATTPFAVLGLIEEAAERHYREYGIRTFIVGNRGSFDQYAATAEEWYLNTECCGYEIDSTGIFYYLLSSSS